MQEESPGFQLTGGHAADLSQKGKRDGERKKGKEEKIKKEEKGKRKAFN